MKGVDDRGRRGFALVQGSTGIAYLSYATLGVAQIPCPSIRFNCLIPMLSILYPHTGWSRIQLPAVSHSLEHCALGRDKNAILL